MTLGGAGPCSDVVIATRWRPAFIESTPQIYKKQGLNYLYGGPAYYIQTALKQNWPTTLSRRFLSSPTCIFQPSRPSVADAFTHYSWANEWTPWIIDAILAALMAGSTFLAVRVATTSPPCLCRLAAYHLPGRRPGCRRTFNYQNILAMFSAIFAGAFDLL